MANLQAGHPVDWPAVLHRASPFDNREYPRQIMHGSAVGFTLL